MCWKALLVVAVQQSWSEESMVDGQGMVHSFQSLWLHVSSFPCCCSVLLWGVYVNMWFTECI